MEKWDIPRPAWVHADRLVGPNAPVLAKAPGTRRLAAAPNWEPAPKTRTLCPNRATALPSNRRWHVMPSITAPLARIQASSGRIPIDSNSVPRYFTVTRMAGHFASCIEGFIRCFASRPSLPR